MQRSKEMSEARMFEIVRNLLSAFVTLTPVSLREIFNFFDKNGDRVVSLAEFVAGFHKLYGKMRVPLPKRSHIYHTFKLMSCNESNTITEYSFNRFWYSALQKQYSCIDVAHRQAITGTAHELRLRSKASFILQLFGIERETRNPKTSHLGTPVSIHNVQDKLAIANWDRTANEPFDRLSSLERFKIHTELRELAN